MITFYIDESGKFDFKDPTQRISLFACVAIPNDKFQESQKFISELKDYVYDYILQKISTKINHSSFRGNEKGLIKKQICAMLDDNFELHMNKIWQGKDIFAFLNLPFKESIIKKTLKFLSDNEITTIVIRSNLDLIERNSTIKDKESYIKTTVCNMLLGKCEDYAKSLNDKGVMILDDGNSMIENEFIQNFWKNPGDVISPDISLVASHKTNLIQLADIIAYIINLYSYNKLDSLEAAFLNYKKHILFYDIK